MPNVKQAHQLIERILECLKKTPLDEDVYRRYMKRPFQKAGLLEDLSPYVKIDARGYILLQYERGIEVLRKRTNDAEEVIYWILEDTIFITVYLGMMKCYGVDQVHTHFPNDPRIHKEIVEAVNDAFRAIGGQYEKWHKEGRRTMIETSKSRTSDPK
ncbi:Imm63 family immunity protein [Bacillus sp. NPDC077027]|uniref:Imm63 family immunity protein n=1 Tax=Bacillus sp. NPDC077027 TaxID=3390548 RepID=UPI003CFFC4F2